MSPALRSWEYVLVAPGVLMRQTRPLAELPDGSVRVRFLYCGLCGSDLSKFEGRRDVRYPVSLGHEFLAEVLELGRGVTEFSPGDLVTSDLNYRCGTCDQCRARRSHLCRTGQVRRFSNRAFAQLGDLDASYLIRVESPPQKHLALSEPLSCVLHAKRWAAPQPNDRVLIVGAGGLGSCLAFALSTTSPPTAFEITDTVPTRAALIESASPYATRISNADGEYDVVFDVSGSESGLRLACSRTAPGGRLCSMSHLDGYSSADFLLAALTRRDITFTVSYLNGERETLEIAASALMRAWSPAWDGLLEVMPVEELPTAFITRREAPWCKTVIALSEVDP